MSERAAAAAPYRQAFECFETEAAARGPLWLRRLRRNAFARFDALGFPTGREEDWRHTGLTELERIPFGPAPAISAVYHPVYSAGGPRIVLVNGRFDPRSSSLAELPDGVVAGSLARMLRESPEQLEPHLGRIADREDHALAALNSAFFEDGAVVIVPAQAELRQPIEIVSATIPGDDPVRVHPRILVLLGERARAIVIESHVGSGETPVLGVPVTEIAIGSESSLDHCRIVRDGSGSHHVGTVQARLGRGARLGSHSFCLGAALTRMDLGAVLAGEGAECTLDGLYLGEGTEHIDNHTMIDHAAPHCPSRELYKGILSGAARAVFNGRIIVRPGAQKTDAKQANRNLRLSGRAAVHTRPQLEIRADDVKCTHGATIGRLDADALFYLRSRGIGEAQARALLIRSFAAEVVGRVPVESLRAALESELLSRLAPGEEGA